MQPENAPESAAPRSDIVVLTATGMFPAMLVNGLVEHFGPMHVLADDGETKWEILRRRACLLGWGPAIGQALFGVASRALSYLSRARRAEIWRRQGLDPVLGPGAHVTPIGTVNGELCRETLRRLAPAVVVVYGTRIIRPETLAAIDAPFINYHAGINPRYRGQSGAYWALSEHHPEHAGITIHLVDQGVDTGDVLYQKQSTFEPGDNFTTYQHVQMADALPLLIRAVEDALAGRLCPYRPGGLPSRQYFMPTLWGYIATGLARHVW